MPLTIEVQAERFGGYADYDVTANGVHKAKLAVGYSHASRFEFSITAANHTLALSYDDFIRVYDPDGYIDGTSEPQDDENPLFEGFVEEIQPGETNEVRIVCYDPTYRSVRKVPLMNAPWDLDSNDEPIAADYAYPRVVFNVTQDNDDDYAFSIGQNLTIGGMIQQVLTDGYLPLYHINAAPGDGTAAGNGQAFLTDDLGEDTSGSSDWIGGLDFEPQEKVVAHSESLRSFVDRLLSQYDPATKLVWQPGERLWRFIRVKESPAVTVTCNARNQWHGMVNTLEINRSIEGRYGAVKFVGPEGVEWRTAEWGDSSGDTLEPVNLVSVGSIPHVGDCYREWQITDPDFTKIANKGPYAIYVPGPIGLWRNASGSVVTEFAGAAYVQSWSPSLQVRFANSDAGSDAWKSVGNIRWDNRTGRIWCGDGCVYRWNPGNPTNYFEEPNGFRFIYPALTEPLISRTPASGYEGTAYTVGGLEAEKVEYDEALAVGYDYGLPVTTVTRLAKFAKLGQQILSQSKDIIYTGGVTFEGVQYEFARLNRRVNIAAQDDNGGTLTTGWESVGAIVTDCEIDFEDQTTTIQFSSDQMETTGQDPDKLRERLKIRPAQQYFFFNTSASFTYRRSRSWMGTWGIVQDTNVRVDITSAWLDEFGEVQ